MKKLLSLILATVMSLSMGVSAFAVDYADLAAFLENAEEVTLPFNATLAVEDHDSYVEYGETYMGYAYKVNLEAGKLFSVTANVTVQGDYAGIILYRYEDSGSYYECLDRAWDAIEYVPETDCTVYAVIGEINPDVTVENAINVEMKSADLTSGLVFGIEDASGENYSYDAETKTLTLTEGFELECDLNGITLPDGAILEVEGNAEVNSDFGHAIYSEGDITVNVAEEKELKLSAPYDGKNGIECVKLVLKGGKIDIYGKEYGINANGDTVIEDCEVKIETYSNNGIDVSGTLEITDCVMDIIADEYGIDTDTTDNDGTVVYDIVITGSEITVEAEDEDGINADNKLVIEDSKIVIEDCDEDGFDAENVVIKNSDVEIHSAISRDYDGIYGDETVTVINSTLKATAGQNGICSNVVKIEGSILELKVCYEVIYAGSIEITDTWFDLESTDGYAVIDAAETFTLPGKFVAEDINGTEMYNGQWKDSLLGDNAGSYIIAVNGAKATHIYSLGEKPVLPDEPEDNNIIDKIEITGVTAPVAGETANYNFEIPADAGYGKYYETPEKFSAWIESETKPSSYADLNTLNWTTVDNPIEFKAEKYYTFVAWTEAKEGYSYAEDVTATVNGENANAYMFMDNTRDVWYTFSCEENTADNIIDKIEITGVAEPVAGEKGSYNYTLPENANYAKYSDPDGDDCFWVMTENAPNKYSELEAGTKYYPSGSGAEQNGISDFTFEAGKFYTFVAWTQVNEGYSFSESATGTVNGDSGFLYRISENYANVWYTFYVEEAPEGQPIEKIEITDVVEPVAGETANFGFTVPDDAGYGKAYFTVGDDDEPSGWYVTNTAPETYEDICNGKFYYFADEETLIFEEGKYYTFVAYTYAKDGYYYADDVTATLNGETATVEPYEDDQYDVWYTFYVEEESEPVDLTLEIPVEKTVTLGSNGAPSVATEFTFELLGYGEEGIGEWATVTGNSVITTVPGTYNTTVTVEFKDEDCFWLLSEGFFIREVNGGLENWTYSDAVYRIFYDYENNVWKIEAYDEANIGEMVIAEKASFTNIYTKTVAEEEEEKPVGPFPRPSLEDRDEEANPNTGAPVLFPVLAAVTLAAAFIGKKK